jgi:hypothetical protein
MLHEGFDRLRITPHVYWNVIACILLWCARSHACRQTLGCCCYKLRIHFPVLVRPYIGGVRLSTSQPTKALHEARRQPQKFEHSWRSWFRATHHSMEFTLRLSGFTCCCVIRVWGSRLYPREQEPLGLGRKKGRTERAGGVMETSRGLRRIVAKRGSTRIISTRLTPDLESSVVERCR